MNAVAALAVVARAQCLRGQPYIKHPEQAATGTGGAISGTTPSELPVVTERMGSVTSSMPLGELKPCHQSCQQQHDA